MKPKECCDLCTVGGPSPCQQCYRKTYCTVGGPSPCQQCYRKTYCTVGGPSPCQQCYRKTKFYDSIVGNRLSPLYIVYALCIHEVLAFLLCLLELSQRLSNLLSSTQQHMRIRILICRQNLREIILVSKPQYLLFCEQCVRVS